MKEWCREAIAPSQPEQQSWRAGGEFDEHSKAGRAPAQAQRWQGLPLSCTGRCQELQNVGRGARGELPSG